MAVKMNSKARKARAKKKTEADAAWLPSWDGHEEWDTEEFKKNIRNAMKYYNFNYSGKDLKHHVINWMGANGYPTKTIKAFKATHDWRVSSTMGGTCANLLGGMPESREDWNEGRNVVEWLKVRIEKVLVQGADDVKAVEPEKKTKATKKVVSVQDRLRAKAVDMSAELDQEYDTIVSCPKKYDVKQFNPLTMLRNKEAKAAHARIIAAMFEKDLAEMDEVLEGKDKQLNEAYDHLTKTEKKKIHTFLKEIVGACTMLQQEGKVNRSTRKKKPKSKDKVVAKLNFKKTDETLKLVSIKPVDIVGANELWVYNVKTRKIGKYIAANPDPQGMGREVTGLNVKGTTIIGFDETASIQKTLRKPAEQLPEWKKLGKVKLRKYLDEIKAVDIKLNGRINPDVILLKVVK